MHFYDIVFTITFWFVRIRSQRGIDTDDTDTDKMEKSTPADNYSFLALIDVVFTDGSKRTCTGTIIHDNVVITAAHCFSMHDIQAELTASFVVIGTKKMFDTGYEQYLPIERVITHPNYRGWTADLALVYTFSGMASDKPGRIIRLASEKTSIPDSDVTVFSWGRSKDDEVMTTGYETESACSEEHDVTNGPEDTKTENIKVTSSFGINSDVEYETVGYNSNTERDDEFPSTSHRTTQNRFKSTKKRTKNAESKYPLRERNIRTTTRLLRSSKEYIKRFHHLKYDKTSNGNFSNNNGKEDRINWKKENLQNIGRKSVVKNKRQGRRIASKRMSYYRNNWRRKMGNQKNKLTAEIFGFVNIQTCSKLVEKTMPTIYEIRNPNEVFCYANEMFYITEEDSGAPAMRRGRLVAVTVGGIDYDGERVAVGMKMICFCSWIAENLPKTGIQLQCCKKCCDPKKEEEYNSKKHKTRKYSDDEFE